MLTARLLGTALHCYGPESQVCQDLSTMNLPCGLAEPPSVLRPSSTLVAEEDGHVAPLPIRAREPGFWKEQPVECLTVTSRE